MSDLRVLGGGPEAFGAILEHIAAAQTSIEIHAFLWCDDEIGNRLGVAILAAAERGVTVRIHKDRVAAVYEYSGGNNQSFFHKASRPTEKFQAWVLGISYGEKGSKAERKELKAGLRADRREAKLKKSLKAFRSEQKLARRRKQTERRERIRQQPNPLVDELLAHANVKVSYEKKRFDHSKIYIFDDRTLVLGSMGIGDDHHNDWIDMMIEVSGEAHVQRMRQRMAGEVEFDSTRRIDFLLHNRVAHDKKTCPMLSERLLLIDSARESVVIEMAYIGDVRFTNALIDAVNRGVDVTLVTGRDVNVCRSLARATIGQMLKGTGAPDNLTIILHPRMVHAKMVVVDGRYCDVGSANFTKLSHGVYDEVNLYIDDVELAADLSRHAKSHLDDGEVVRGPLSYKKFVSQVERATVAYQSRNGAKS